MKKKKYWKMISEQEDMMSKFVTFLRKLNQKKKQKTKWQKK